VKQADSITRKAKQYVAELMRDGNERSMGEVLIYAAKKFTDEGRSIGATTIKRSVERALEDKSQYVWLGYGRYHYKPAYLQGHNLADYAGRRISAALGKAILEIKDCCEQDLAGAEADRDSGKVLTVATAILGSLDQYEKAIEAAATPALSKDVNDKPSVCGMLALAREGRHQTNNRDRKTRRQVCVTG
jgi:hypothetical protein